jgi:hypothetical protein
VLAGGVAAGSWLVQVLNVFSIAWGWGTHTVPLGDQAVISIHSCSSR